MTFSDLSLHSSLVQALTDKGYEQPTPVQIAVLDEAHRSRDLLVSSRTGSGKTVAFGLALAPMLLETEGASTPEILVVAPTRELAQQVQRELEWLYGRLRIRVVSCVGGMDIRRERRALAEGARVVVGTPGRLVDHLERGSLDLTGIGALVLDEADEMLDMGFRDELERLLRDAPSERRTLLFSATLPDEILRLANKYQRDAVRLSVTPAKAAHEDIEYRAHLVAPREREHAVVNTLRHHEASGAIVFCQTREGVNHLNANLLERGFESVALSGELSQAERTRALKALRDGRARVLVATDVAARGLDLPALGLVVHADPPHDAQVLQHRSGRTGRAGRKGVSVLLVPPYKRRSVLQMLSQAGIRVNWTAVPSPDEIRTLDRERMIEKVQSLTDGVTADDRETARAMLEKVSTDELVAVLARQLRESRPAPEELPLSEGLELPGEKPKVRGKERPFERPFERTERRPVPESREPRARPEGRRPKMEGAWFRINVGRAKGADPRWILPLLCRRGMIDKKDIGAIRVMDTETRIEIAASAAERFEMAATRPDKNDPGIRISRAVGPPPPEGERPAFGETKKPFVPRKGGLREDFESRPPRKTWKEKTPGFKPTKRPPRREG